ncbi:galactose mutarotase-like superfamily protein [Wolffia australiana]
MSTGAVKAWVFVLLIMPALHGLVSSIQPIEYFELKKGNFTIKCTNWGATIISVILPDSKGKLSDIALGYDTDKTLGKYLENPSSFGALVGRVANRISGAKFTLNGKQYRLFPNDGNNSLHGGHRGFSKVMWDVKEKDLHGPKPFIKFHYHSFDGEQGFPGALEVFVTYTISDDDQLSVTMEATPAGKPTPVNLVQHVYWNLAGHDSGSVLGHKLQIFASRVTPLDQELIPTGQVAAVNGTPFDFLTPRPIGSRIGELTGGYDINYVLDKAEAGVEREGMWKAALVRDSGSGRTMELWTDQVGVQLYTSNMLKAVGKGGAAYGSHAGLCLETQGFPDSVNRPQFPSQIVQPGARYLHRMLFRFSMG